MGVKWLISYRLTNDDNCEDRKGTFVVAYIKIVGYGGSITQAPPENCGHGS